MGIIEKIFGGSAKIGTNPEKIKDLERKTAEIDERAEEQRKKEENEEAQKIEELRKKITGIEEDIGELGNKNPALTEESLQNEIDEIRAARDNIQEQIKNEDNPDKV